jgi:hypothetical protein
VLLVSDKKTPQSYKLRAELKLEELHNTDWQARQLDRFVLRAMIGLWLGRSLDHPNLRLLQAGRLVVQTYADGMIHNVTSP